jgi:hypothetical protein
VNQIASELAWFVLPSWQNERKLRSTASAKAQKRARATSSKGNLGDLNQKQRGKFVPHLFGFSMTLLDGLMFCSFHLVGSTLLVGSLIDLLHARCTFLLV